MNKINKIAQIIYKNSNFINSQFIFLINKNLYLLINKFYNFNLIKQFKNYYIVIFLLVFYKNYY
jgi:hypothetical protein